MLIYSIDDSDTFDSLTNWADNAVCGSIGGPLETITVLVGNKSDLSSERAVDASRAKQYADNNDIQEDMIFEVSAKTGEGVQEMFDKIALKMKPSKRSQPPSREKKKFNC